jgi:hypothetical protein
MTANVKSILRFQFLNSMLLTAFACYLEVNIPLRALIDDFELPGIIFFPLKFNALFRQALRIYVA